MARRIAAGRVAAATVAAAYYSLCLLRAADAACSDEPLDISWASSSNRIYVNSGCARMADIMIERSDNTGAKGPLYHFDMDANTIVDSYTGTYYLTSHIHVRNNATLEIDGDHPDDGDCEILLMAAGPNYNGTDSLNIRAHGGNLVIRKTKIFSWDIDLADYDTNTDDGRPYISAITEFITGREVDLCNDDELKGTEGYSTGEAKENMGVARMDIYSSELAYLGWDNSESYGVSYKARGLCKTLSNLDIFDDDQAFDYAVYGDIKRSELHHNYFGHYSYGHQGGRWKKNKVHNNIGYGFDPHDDSDHLLIKENEVYNNGWHGIIASKRCTDVDIKMNKVYNNGQNGIMLHRSCDRANVRNNEVWDNGDAGIALYESSDSAVTLNKLTGNVQGIRWSNGANRNYVYKNEIWHDSDDGYAVYMYRGSDEPLADGNENGDILENSFHRNTVYSGRSEAMKITYAHDNSFLNNVITEGEYARFVNATNNKWKRNPVPDDFYFVIDEDNSCMGPNDEGLDTC